MSDEREERVLILAPVGRDAALARETLNRAGLAAEICSDIQGLCDEAASGVGAILLTQEALSREALERLLGMIRSQPPWSDVPIVVLVSGAEATTAIDYLSAVFGHDVNASFRERPVRAATLANAIHVALRSRRRQYELRDHLAALAAAQESERQSRLAAEQSVRIRDEFLASVAHDLKNPLGAIKGYAQLLKRQASKLEFAGSDVLVDGLTKIDAMVGKIVVQIDELLDLARLQAGQPLPLSLEPTDLVALAERVAEDFRPTTTHRIEVKSSDEEAMGVWDRLRLEQVLGNLLSNAIKYSPGGGDITVEVRQEKRGPDCWALLAVRDQGIGIPASDLPHVFDRFYRARNTEGRDGTGLGLAGVKKVVEQHGGTVRVESTEGQGSVFTVYLPIVQLDPGPSARDLNHRSARIG